MQKITIMLIRLENKIEKKLRKDNKKDFNNVIWENCQKNQDIKIFYQNWDFYYTLTFEVIRLKCH